MEITLPFLFVQRYISANDFSTLLKFLVARLIVAASKASFLNGSVSALAWTNSTLRVKSSSLARSSISRVTSTPTTSAPFLANSKLKSPVPQAMSRILDIACGTGLLSFEFARKGALVVGVDVSREMLDRAKELDLTRRVEFVQARAETLPFRNDAFDAATISLATRNLSSVEKSFAEMYRCTKRNGSVISMDFARPIERTFSAFYLFYIFRILPAFGLLVSRHWNGIFVYLANSIARSKSPEQLASILSKVGAQSTKVTRMTHGVTAIVSGQKI